MSDNNTYPIKWFRDSSPYINAHRKKTFVLVLGDTALLAANLQNVVGDIALLNSLGVRLVIIFDASTAINARLEALGIARTQHDNRHIVTPEELSHCQAEVGKLRSDLEALLSVGLINSPLHGSDITVTSGNFVKARPIGIIDGVDHHHSGVVRRINSQAIASQLALGSLVLIPPIGFSVTGELFVLEAAPLAKEIAVALAADKLIYLIEDAGVCDESGDLISELQTNEIDQVSDQKYRQLLTLIASACQKGVARCHLISAKDDGALLEELFTRDGAGTQITLRSYEQIKQATAEDVAAIIALIEPLQLEGILVKRSAELIESEIDRFTVIERDGLIVACAALYPFGHQGELACLATHPDYRDGDRGDRLLEAIEKQARSKGITELFALTTHTAHWFKERGFSEGQLSQLPTARFENYNQQRKSRLLLKPVTAAPGKNGSGQVAG